MDARYMFLLYALLHIFAWVDSGGISQDTDVPTQLRAQNVTARSMSLSWRRPSKLDPIKYMISYGARKEFYDSQGSLLKLMIPTHTVFVNAPVTEYHVDNLMPFTSYQVNITAIPEDESFRPPAHITVTTAVAAPKPMVKPMVKNGWDLAVILPKASEEYGPINHYFLVVVPTKLPFRDPGEFTNDELSSTPVDQIGPYIAAKFMHRSIPEIFHLGDGKNYSGYLNKKLQDYLKYHIFVRAVVDAPQKSLYVSSPFSDPMSLVIYPRSSPAPPFVPIPTDDRDDHPLPEKPRNVKVDSFNSTAIKVRWKAPTNGVISGYRIHVQKITRNGDLLDKPKRYYVADEKAREYNVTKLQPDTLYSVRVAAVTKKGVGTRSIAKKERTLCGVPTPPKLTVQLMQEEPTLIAQVQWSPPTYIYGQLKSYKLRFGRADTQQMEEREFIPFDQVHEILNLDRGARYEFYLSGKNGLGWGQEAYTYLDTPEGGICSYRKYSPHGVIKSPNYPQYYPTNKDCAWLFTTAPGHRIKLVFKVFKLEPYDACAHDYIAAYDGDSDESPSLGKFCGSEVPQPILSSGNRMYLVFKSDGSVQKKGFKATHTTVCGGRLLANGSMEPLNSHAKYGYQSYDKETDCDWIVRGINDQRVKLKFLTFEVESEKYCEYDYVEVYDGDDDSAKSFGKFCGNTVPPEIDSSGNSLMIRFRTDDTINTKGFSAAYKVL